MELKEFERLSIEQKLTEIYRIHLPENVTIWDKSISKKLTFNIKNNHAETKRIAITANDYLLEMFSDKIQADAVLSDQMDGFDIKIGSNNSSIKDFMEDQKKNPLEIFEINLVSGDYKNHPFDNKYFEFYQKGTDTIFLNLTQYFSKYQQVLDRIDIDLEDRFPIILNERVLVFTIEPNEELYFTIRLGERK